MHSSVGCEKVGTSEIDCEQSLVFLEAAVENGTSKKDALQDLRMIDAMLKMSKLHRVVHVHVKKTQAGYSRKGVGFYDCLERIVEGRVDGAFNY